MATEKQLIYKEDVIAMAWLADECEVVTASYIEDMPAVDAVLIDEIKFLYMAIDKNGIPELKVQLGDRILCLRRENDPVDVVSVVRCKVCKWRNTRRCPYMNFNAAVRDDSDYCSDGERKDNE